MRKEKPLPRESSFKEFSNNREKNGNRRPSAGARSSGYKSRSSGVKSGFKQDYKRRDNKHDRRDSRGNSFKDDKRSSRGRGQGDREMFDAVCAKCGKSCKVPFKPTNGKPVYCSDCFRKEAGNDSDQRRGNRYQRQDIRGRTSDRGSSWKNVSPSSRGVERRSRNSRDGNNNEKFARTNSGVRQLYDAVCMKCGKPCKVPFKPVTGKGVSCSNCFVKNEKPGRGRSSSDGRKFSNRGKKSFGNKRSSYSNRR